MIGFKGSLFGGEKQFKNVQKRLTMRIFKLLVPILIGIFLAVSGVHLKELVLISSLDFQAAMAQSLRPEYVANIVYQRLPYLPQENQYISQETGKIDDDNSLISRFIRYHDYVKNRPTIFRFDWKLTLADYLGTNEPIQASRYPGASTLKTNPMAEDVKILTSLNRRQRSELVDVLVSIYNPQTENTPNSPSPSQTIPKPSLSPSPSKLPLSKPGDAQLLIP